MVEEFHQEGLRYILILASNEPSLLLHCFLFFLMTVKDMGLIHPSDGAMLQYTLRTQDGTNLLLRNGLG